MVPKRRLGFAVAFVLGCSRESPVYNRASMEHGLSVGDRITPAPITCAGGEKRLAVSNEVQVITFVTPYDCPLCSQHLAGLLELQSSALQPESFIVLWSPNQKQLQRQAQHLAARYAVCADSSGAFWRTHQITHTPFTVVLRNGKVVYLNDRPLTEERFREEFIEDLSRFARQ